MPVLLRANIKVIREITPIVIDLWQRRCEVAFGKLRKSKIKNQRELLSKKSHAARKTNISTGRVSLHFKNPPREGTSLSLVKAWIKTSEEILKKIQRRQQRDQQRHHLITNYSDRLIRQATSRSRNSQDDILGVRQPLHWRNPPHQLQDDVSLRMH